ncbi:hypothetical protein [Mucilaginibacter gilvus]|uniref:Uncharacterized protein n=1 Tax=Mucilaginibacter gilvus TaxID=2305909 RepID=A0A444MTS8_9SPHI|nr:hypothetical protein [Mucilaginibacter gilvus]RWY57036.1 hypothetical protein EPL05_00445 [Mucilaginibacter gilvus]
MIKIDKTNYDLYKKVFEIIWQHKSTLTQAEAYLQGINIGNLPSPVSMLNNLETKSKPLALKSMKLGFSDIFSMLKYAPDEFKKALDDDLKANGLPGYFLLYSQSKYKLSLILKRQTISLMEEYYFVMEILNDITTEITEEERHVLNKCVLTFEQKQAKKNRLKD